MPGSAAAADSSLRRLRLGALSAALLQRRALAASLLLFALALPPVLLASWGFGRALAGSELDKLDLRVAAAVAAADANVARRADAAATEAAALARTQPLQDALRRRDLAALERLLAAHPGTQAVLPNGEVAGELPAPPRLTRRVDVGSGAAALGSLVTGASFGPVLGGSGGVSVVAAPGGRIAAGPLRGAHVAPSGSAVDVRGGGRVFRVEALRVDGGAIVGLADRRPVDALVRRRQEQIVVAVLASLAALAFGMGLLIRGRRRRADRLRSAGAVTLIENLLRAMHDPDAMLAVVLESAVAVAGAAGGSLSWQGETVRRGAVAADSPPLEIDLLDGEGASAGRLTLVAEDEPFDRETTELVRTVVNRGIAALEAAQRQRVVQHQALTDELTGLPNRRRFREALDVEVARAERSGTPLSVILADLDDFKVINDEHGHYAGDEVLLGFARILGERLRATDLAARLGGDEFVVLLPDTALAGAVALAENLRTALVEEGDALRRSTASFGAAIFVPGGSGESLLRVADDALYTAKRAGRNRVVAAADVLG